MADDQYARGEQQFRGRTKSIKVELEGLRTRGQRANATLVDAQNGLLDARNELLNANSYIPTAFRNDYRDKLSKTEVEVSSMSEMYTTEAK
ncbi:MAG: hypothetical protein IPG92_00005 [Flavobacteriales bacterium]|nr:hypothetical protein [Flavobacteriales bacterium]